MQLVEYYTTKLALPAASILNLTRFAFDGATYTVTAWDASLGTAPTSAQLAAVAALPEPAGDHYWLGQPVGAASPVVYGSARAGLVATPATDTDYQAWLATGPRLNPASS